MIRGKRSPIVHVVAFKKDGNSKIQLKVKPEVLDLTQFVKSGLAITWKIDTHGYRFSNEGPTIEFTSPDWEKSFSKPRVSKNGKSVVIYNRNRDGLAFSYNVHVEEQETGLKAFLDPVVQNNQW